MLNLIMCLVWSSSTAEPHVGTKDKNFMQLRSLGFEAYAEKYMTESARNFTLSIDNYWERKRLHSMCIQQCLYNEDFVDEMQSIHVYLQAGTCVEKCCYNNMGPPVNIEDSMVDDIFRRNQYYSIIQSTWHSARNFTGNIEAAKTFVLFNPNNVGMHLRLVDLERIYVTEDEDGAVRQGNVQPRNVPWYHSQYTTGVNHYYEEEWAPCVYHLESALEHFFRDTGVCRARCTYPYDRITVDEKVDSFMRAAEKIVRETAECRAHCYDELQLKSFSGSPYLASIFEYLQFCQYRMGSLQDAADSTHSYTLLDVHNPVINGNIEYFRDDFKLTGKPRKDVTDFLRKYKIDMGLSTDKDLKKKQSSKEKIVFGSSKYFGVHGLLNTKQCKGLITLAEEGASNNDGYEGYKEESSPHNKNEKFSGLSITSAIKMLEQGDIEVEEIQLYFEVVKAAKEYLVERFKIVKYLYFDYIHLVKRSVIDNDPKGDVGVYSHRIHGDNCNIHNDGACVKEPPALVHRDWSALLYLNSPSSGGELVITDSKMEPLAELVPRCGAMAGFTADTLHGVKALTGGDRYAIGLWFTHDIDHAIDMDSLQRRIEDVIEREDNKLKKDEL